MPILIALKLFAGNALGKLWTFLRGLNVWQLALLAVSLFALVQHFQLAGERRHSAKLQAQITKTAEQSREFKRERDEANARIAAEIRKRTDEENRRIAAGADDLRLSGPGRSRASCPPAASGGHVAPGGNGDAPGPQMPSADGATVSWSWLVNRAEQNDLNRAEILAWRDWYARLAEQRGGKKSNGGQL